MVEPRLHLFFVNIKTKASYMILDKLEHHATYAGLGENLKKGFEWLANTYTLDTPEGKYAIDGDEVYAIVTSYKTKPYSEGEFESHKKYLDIQYIPEGEEMICVTGLEHLIPKTDFDFEKDIVFYTGDGEPIRLPEGYFMVLFPQDGHKPGIMTGSERLGVKKVVVKVRC
ncbi:MAG: beta-D-galactosidase [Chlorobiota bacterium]